MTFPTRLVTEKFLDRFSNVIGIVKYLRPNELFEPNALVLELKRNVIDDCDSLRYTL